jgi:hypothetical protein
VYSTQSYLSSWRAVLIFSIITGTSCRRPHRHTVGGGLVCGLDDSFVCMPGVCLKLAAAQWPYDTTKGLGNYLFIYLWIVL